MNGRTPCAGIDFGPVPACHGLPSAACPMCRLRLGLALHAYPRCRGRESVPMTGRTPRGFRSRCRGLRRVNTGDGERLRGIAGSALWNCCSTEKAMGPPFREGSHMGPSGRVRVALSARQTMTDRAVGVAACYRNPARYISSGRNGENPRTAPEVSGVRGRTPVPDPAGRYGGPIAHVAPRWPRRPRNRHCSTSPHTLGRWLGMGPTPGPH